MCLIMNTSNPRQGEHADYNDYSKNTIKMRTLIPIQVGRHPVVLRKELSFQSFKTAI